MADLFDERERGYEAKWARDQEARFKIIAKRNARLAQWAAETMKLAPSEAERYVEAVTNAALAGKGDDALVEKLRGDFKAKGVSCPASAIYRKIREFSEKAAAGSSR